MRPADVIVEAPEDANLLELMLASLLRRRLADPQGRAHARALRGPVAIEAGTMRATLTFGEGAVSVSRGAPDSEIAAIRGSLPAFVDAALGRRRLEHLVRGRLAARGRPRALWHVIALLGAGRMS